MKEVENELLATKNQFAVTIKVAAQDAHAVIVKGVSEIGNYLLFAVVGMDEAINSELMH